MKECPSEIQLDQYLNDSLTPGESVEVTTHIDTCPSCQTRLDNLTSHASSIAKHYTKKSAATQTSKAYLKGIVPESGESEAAATRIFGGGESISFAQTSTPIGKPDVPGYTIETEIGRGGMGVVYKAQHKRLNRTVALKMVLAGGVSDPRVVQRFLFEAEVLARIQHVQVVQVYEVNIYQGPTGVAIPYLAMELLEAGTLAHWSDKQKKTPREAAGLVAGLARAVQAIHQQGVIHRDLKPANILRGLDGTFKVSDFGLAKLTQGGENMTHSGAIVGTPQYMSPEQASGEKNIGPQTDVYALGAILYELLVGHPPFHGNEPMNLLLRVIKESVPDVRSLRVDLPKDLCAIVMKCLTKEPHRRYSSAGELADDLERYLDNKPINARAHGRMEQLWYWSRRNPMIASLVSSLFLVTIVSFISVLTLWREAVRTAGIAQRESEEANIQRIEANKRKDEADAQRMEADRAGSFLAFDQAVNVCEQGQIDEGLKGFIRALELAERTGNTDLQRACRANIAAWEAELFPVAQELIHTEKQRCTGVDYSFDGTRLASYGSDGNICLWDTDKLKKLAVLSVEFDRFDPRRLITSHPTIWSVSFNPQKTRIAAGTDTGFIWLWDGEGKFLRTWKCEVTDKNTYCIGFGNDGTLWTGGSDGFLKNWNVEKGELIKSTEKNRQNSVITVIALTKDGSGILAGDRNARVVEYDTNTCVPVRQWTGPIGWVNDLAISPNEEFIATTGTERRTIIWSRLKTNVIMEVNLAGAYGKSVAIGHTGRKLMVGDEDGNLRLWDLATALSVGGPLRVGTFRSRFQPGREILAIPVDGKVRLQPVYVPRPQQMKMLHNGKVRALQFHPDGQQLLVSAGSYALRIHNAETGEILQLLAPYRENAPKLDVLTASFDDKGERVLYGQRGSWGVIDTKTEPPTILERTSGYTYISTVEIAPDGRIHIFESGNHHIWSADAKKLIKLTRTLTDTVESQNPEAVGFIPNTTHMWLAMPKFIRTIDTKDNSIVGKDIPQHDEIQFAKATVDGRFVFAGYRDNSAQLWDLQTGKPVFTTQLRHRAAITHVETDPKDRYLFTASRDGIVQIWDRTTGLPIGPRLRHSEPLAMVAINPQGDKLATGSVNGRVIVWPMPPAPDTASLDDLRKRIGKLTNNAKSE